MRKFRLGAICLILLLALQGCNKKSTPPIDAENKTENVMENNETKKEDVTENTDTSSPDVDDNSDETPDNTQNQTENSSAENSGLKNPSTAGTLKVTGTQLTDANGNPIQLRGISTHGLSWFPDYVNNECFSELKNNWNANVIRLAMYTADYNGYCTGGNQSDLKNLVCNGIEYAARQDMYVIVDWHILSDNNPNTYIEESKKFFHEISSKYANQNHILYEICNEPNSGTDWNQIKSYAEAIIPVIRANDPDAIIIVGTPNWCQYVEQAAADPITGYDNIMYSLHFYAATHKDDLRNKMSSAVAAGLPIFVTEYGICDASGNGNIDTEQANLWVSAMNKLGISYVAWNLSNKNESSAILKSSCSKINGFTQEDLSTAGKWLYEMLSGQTNLPSTNPSNNKQPTATDSTPPNITNNNLSISLSITGSWESNGVSYYQYSMTLKNNGDSACSNWSVDLPCDSSTSLSDGWNGIYSLKNSTLHISSTDYNGTIPSGGSISDMGFIIYGGKIQL